MGADFLPPVNLAHLSTCLSSSHQQQPKSRSSSTTLQPGCLTSYSGKTFSHSLHYFESFLVVFSSFSAHNSPQIVPKPQPASSTCCSSQYACTLSPLPAHRTSLSLNPALKVTTCTINNKTLFLSVSHSGCAKALTHKCQHKCTDNPMWVKPTGRLMFPDQACDRPVQALK